MSLMLISQILMVVALALVFYSMNKNKNRDRCPKCNADKNYFVVATRGNERDVRCKSCKHEWIMTKGKFEFWNTLDWMKKE